MTGEPFDQTNEQGECSIASEQWDIDDQQINQEYPVTEITKPDDQLDRLNAFFNQSQIKQELHWFTHRDTLERAVDREDRALFYVELDQTIAGGVMVWCRSRVLPANVAQIRLIAVDPEYRGQGIARSLISKAMSFASTHNQSTMRADAAIDSQAVEFWKRLGFEITGEYETSGGRAMYETRRPIITSDQ